MRLPLRILLLLALATLFAASCSATTVVASDERADSDEAAPSTSETSEQPAGANDGDNDGESAASSGAPNDDQTDTQDEAADTDEDADEAPESARDLQETAGFGLGGDAQLGTLSDDCIDDSDMACDILFQVSGFDSDEEATALTCGGRSEVEVIFCTKGIDAVPNQVFFDEDSDALPAIVSACEDDGDMTACDFLYARSPVESDSEALGATCGGRVDVAIPNCRTFLSES